MSSFGASGGRRLAAVWFADVVGFTRLASIDEDAALEIVAGFHGVARSEVERHGGRIVKLLGDGALAEFASADSAARAALAVRGATGTGGESAESGPRVRIGIHLGEVVATPDGDLYGDGVNLASRLHGAAAPGEIVVSEDVWRQLRRRPGFEFEAMGERPMRGIDEPVAVHRLVSGPETGPRHEAARPRPEWRSGGGALLRRAAIGAVVTITLATLLVASLRDSADRSGSARAGEASASIAVLPFEDMTPERDNEYFADGMAEELINALSRIDDLRVASRTSAFAFKGRPTTTQEVGRALGVGTVLEGSVRKSADRLRVTTRLVEAESGYEIWSAQYDRRLEDVFAIQEEIAEAVVRELELELAGSSAEEEIVVHGTDEVEAYNLYLRGLFHWNRRTAEDLHEAIDRFEKALEIDPRYALAWAGIANAYVVLPFHDLRPREAFPRAREAAARAIEIDPGLPQPHAALGAYHTDFEWNFAAAERAFERALELDPHYSTGLQWYGEYLGKRGRYDEAISILERARRSDPLSRIIGTEIGLMQFFAGRTDAAVEAYREVLDLDPAFGFAWMHLARALLRVGGGDEAMEAAHRAVELSGRSSEPLATHAYTLAVTGHRLQAEAVLREMEGRSRRQYIRSSDLALVHVGLGEKRRAIDFLERGYEERDSQLVYLAVDPVFDPLRDDPRFVDLCERIGLEGCAR